MLDSLTVTIARLPYFLRDALEHQSDLLHRGLTFWTGLVVIGLLYELLEAFLGRAFESLSHKHRQRFIALWVPVFGKVGIALVIIGVTGELFVGFKEHSVNNWLRTIDDGIIATIRLDTSRANERSKELEVTAANLKGDNLALEAAIQPRRLSDSQQQAIGDACHRFANARIRVEITPFLLDMDGRILAPQIAEALRRGRMNDIVVTIPVLPLAPAGLTVGVIVTGTALEQDFVRALTASLNAAGVFTTAAPPRSDFPGNVGVRVGIKPLVEKPLTKTK